MLSHTTLDNRLSTAGTKLQAPLVGVTTVPGRGQGGLRDATFPRTGAEDERQPKATSGRVGWGEGNSFIHQGGKKGGKGVTEIAGSPPMGLPGSLTLRSANDWVGSDGKHTQWTLQEWPPSELEDKGERGQDRLESGTDSGAEVQAQCLPCRNWLTDPGELLNLSGLPSHLG